MLCRALNSELCNFYVGFEFDCEVNISMYFTQRDKKIKINEKCDEKWKYPKIRKSSEIKKVIDF